MRGKACFAEGSGGAGGSRGGCTKAGERFWPPSLIFDDVMISDGALTGSIPVVMKIIREDINEKKRFLSGIARMREGGVCPGPNFLALFQEVHFYRTQVRS